jgi:hypothetical protein
MDKFPLPKIAHKDGFTDMPTAANIRNPLLRTLFRVKGALRFLKKHWPYNYGVTDIITNVYLKQLKAGATAWAGTP